MNVYTRNANKVIKRMQDTQDYIVGINSRYYWANDNVMGCLVEAASSEEVAIVQELSRYESRIILRDFKRIKI